MCLYKLKSTKMKIIVPIKVCTVIKSLGNATRQKNALKIYTALYLRMNRANNNGYFSCPSTYLKKINSRYSEIVDAFIKAGIMKPFEKLKEDPNDIFNTIKKKYYHPDRGIAIKYKFLIDPTNGVAMEVDFENKRRYRWYDIISDSLEELGYEPRIKRDNFGGRVYHPLIKPYKTVLKDKGLWVIDAKASHPTLLWLVMKERGVRDESYFQIFEKGVYFYDYLIEELKLENKEAAKQLFSEWLNSRGFVSDTGIYKLFPEASHFIQQIKRIDYKDSAAFFHNREAKIWIDDLLQNIPVQFALPVHDSLIVKAEDACLVLEYCKEKYPEIDFDFREL